MRRLNLRDGEADEHTQQCELDQKRGDQYLGIQLNAAEVHGRDKKNGSARYDMHAIGRQPLDHLRRVRGEGECDDDGGNDTLAQVGATCDEPQRWIAELARPGESAAFVREVDTDRDGA